MAGFLDRLMGGINKILTPNLSGKGNFSGRPVGQGVTLPGNKDYTGGGKNYWQGSGDYMSKINQIRSNNAPTGPTAPVATTPAVVSNTAQPEGGLAPDGSFNIPFDKFQRSESGLDWENPFVKEMIGNVSKYAGQLPGNIKGLKSAMYEPERFQGTLNELASKGMLNSSVAGTALAKRAQDIDKEIMALEMGLPEQFANLAQLGQRSVQEDPLEPYRLMSNILMGL